MEGDFIKVHKWLMPLAWLYGLGVKMRNILFEMSILKSRSFNVPIIAVGNITVGGTGKTPHVEYLVKLLKNKYNVAVLSRGYKRKTRGFILADEKDTAKTIGDEPYQMKRKFPDINVAVDANRCRGIERLMSNMVVADDVDTIILDDAFQHRYVKPGVNILLVDYHRLIIYDSLLPAGRLREPATGKSRADIIIVTKCPQILKPMEYRVIMKAMNPYPYQELYFTTLAYGDLQPIFCGEDRPLETIAENEQVMLLTGIASPEHLMQDLEPYAKNIHTMLFDDHHEFTEEDVERINSEYDALPEPKLIITTEKDAARLCDVEGLSDEVRRHIYALPVRIMFMFEQEEKFNEKIIGYVRTNSRNSILAKGKNDNKPKDCDNTGHRTRTISFRNN